MPWTFLFFQLYRSCRKMFPFTHCRLGVNWYKYVGWQFSNMYYNLKFSSLLILLLKMWPSETVLWTECVPPSLHPAPQFIVGVLTRRGWCLEGGLWEVIRLRWAMRVELLMGSMFLKEEERPLLPLSQGKGPLKGSVFKAWSTRGDHTCWRLDLASQPPGLWAINASVLFRPPHWSYFVIAAQTD